ncbi:MAG: carboxy-S-adenosyl-L-methionine synthase CmoA [bacterium]
MTNRDKKGKQFTAPDTIFATRRERIDDFDFGAETAAVFDDMLDRSVPHYAEIQRMTGELVGEFVEDGTSVYDLGCSTATTILHVARSVPPEVTAKFVGIDSSREMLEIAKKKLDAIGFGFPYELKCADLNDGVHVVDASVVLLILTLQFVRPLHRERLLRSVEEGLEKGGCVVLVEKVLGRDSTLNRLFIERYYEMKRRNGYSDLEIAQKREALENVLVPYQLEENLSLLRDVGFSATDVFFKWYNFCGIIAVK